MSEARTYADVNAVVGSYLRDFAFAQSSQQKMFGYKRPAAAILALDMPLTELIQPDGTLSRIGGIGPDAHTTAQLSYAETALAHARLAGIPADRIVYCWPLERLLAWFADPLCECRQ